VDFKTSVNPKTRAEAAHDPQLGVYQLVVEAGAYTPTPADDEAGEESGTEELETGEPETGEPGAAESETEEPESAGPIVAQAELVYPRDKSDAPGPTVLVQPGQSTQPDPQWAANLVAEVAQRVLDERFFAYGEAPACKVCRLRKACPKQPEGRELPS
jgi:hypothetical protein